MTLTPVDETHALQIQAGVLGRKAGHAFEDALTSAINALPFPVAFDGSESNHVAKGNPAYLLLKYVAAANNCRSIQRAVALSTGALATSEEGKKWLSVNGANVHRCKSDVILTIDFPRRREITIGISTKQCNNPTPTNAQLYFTTARGFSKLLRDNGIHVSEASIQGLRRFCGDMGFRPLDSKGGVSGRLVDPRRYFWEELGPSRNAWEKTLAKWQDEITRLLLQKAYIDDVFTPDFLIHKTRKAVDWNDTEVAIYSIDELVRLSRSYSGFSTKSYSVRKGSYKDPAGTAHQAPRFGVVQMQRGGQAQHPEQLQFNLEAGYFYKI